MSTIELSLVIPCKNKNDPKLSKLLESIDAQDYPKDKMETLIITEGTSESAKAIGIRKAKGEIIGLLASDNELSHSRSLHDLTKGFPSVDSYYLLYYEYRKEADVLTRYFALVGGNDPLSFYMNKNDKLPYWKRGKPITESYFRSKRSIGDNGFFIKRYLIGQTNLDSYYHIDNAHEAMENHVQGVLQGEIFHNTGGSCMEYFRKRYHYGLQHAFNKDRRWHLVDLKKGGDILRLIWFILASVTFIHPLVSAMRGYIKIRDIAWFIHPIMCFLTVVTYGILVCHLCLRRMYQSLSAL